MAKILIVEDEPDLRETIVEELKDEGHLTIEAGNGLEGLERLVDETPDMIISDITMPKMNGYQFFRSVKEKYPNHEFTPFIFLSALSDRESQLKGLRLGVDDYLTKPVDFDLLLMKVDLNLRRQLAHSKRLVATDAASVAPSPPSSEDDDVEPPSTTSFDAIFNRQDGKLLTTKFETISDAKLEAAFGDHAATLSDQIRQHAEAAIRDHLDPDDALHLTSSNDFLVVFAKLPTEDVETKASLIRDAIWEVLFKHSNDEKLASTHARSCALMAGGLSDIEDDAVLPAIDQLFEEARETARDAEAKMLVQSYHHDSLYAQKMLTPTNAASKVKLLTFEKETLKRNRKLLNEGRYHDDFLIELHRGLFQRLRERRAFHEAFAKSVMLLPIRFQMLVNESSRERLVKLCAALEDDFEATIIVELIETPDRFHSSLAQFKPLPIGRQLQFVELRRLEQLGSLELGQLGDLGVAFFSMRFEHVQRQDKDVLRHLIQTFEANGIKFCIKEVPKDQLNEAQEYNAHLYSSQ